MQNMMKHFNLSSAHIIHTPKLLYAIRMLPYIMSYIEKKNIYIFSSCNKSFQEHICLLTGRRLLWKKTSWPAGEIWSLLPAHTCHLCNKASARAAVPTNVINTMLLYHFRCYVKNM